MSEEISKYFTQEEFSEHLCFLTDKEELETEINEIKENPNLYNQKDEILNTEDMDAQFEEYITFGAKLAKYITNSCDTYIKIGQVLMLQIAAKKRIEYSPLQPQFQDPNTFYVTPQLFDTKGLELNYTTNFDGVKCHYFYTGSIEEGTDKGLMMFENGLHTVMEGAPQREARYMYTFDPATNVASLMITKNKSSGGAFEKYPDKILVRISEVGMTYSKDDREGETSFTVIRFNNDGSYLYGDFTFNQELNQRYSPKAVQVIFEDQERKEISVKYVGEHSYGFFLNGYTYSKAEDKLTEFVQTHPNRFSKLISYEAHKVYQSYQLTKDDFERYNLDQIKNLTEENLPELTLNCYIHMDPTDPSGQRLATHGASLYHGLVYLDLIEVVHTANCGLLLSIDSDEPDFNKIKEEAEEIQKRSQTTGQFGIRVRGLIIDGSDPNQHPARYEGQSIDKYAHGQGCRTHGNQIKFEGTFQNHEFVEGEMTYLEDAFAQFRDLETGSGEGFPLKMIGKFSNNQLNDPNGKIVYEDGTVFEGNVESNLSQGQGRLVFASGDVYEGNFLHGSAHGLGKLAFKSGDVYTGEFDRHSIKGEGELRRLNGDVYTGRVVEDEANASILNIEGKLVRVDGSESEGSFRVNVEDGAGGGEGGAGGGSGGGSVGGGGDGGTGGATLGMMRLWGLQSPHLLTPAFMQPLESRTLFVDGFLAENRTMKALESTYSVLESKIQFGKAFNMKAGFAAFSTSRKMFSLKAQSSLNNLKTRVLPRPAAWFNMMKRVMI